MLHSRMLRYLDEVVRSGSIRRAADKLNVSSSSINRQIIELEAQMGTPLFDRLPRRMRPTAAGEILITHIRQTLREHEKARFRIAELSGVGRGTVRLATMNGLASGLLPALCNRFAEDYPGIRFEIRSLLAPEIVKAVEDGEVSFGFGYNVVPTANQRTVASYGARLGVVASVAHPLATRSALRLADLAGHHIAMADETLTIRAIIDAACKKADVTLDMSVETNSVQLMKFLVNQGTALAFLSSPDVDTEVGDGSFVFLPLKDRMEPNPLRIIEREGAPLAASTAVFLEVLQRRLAELVPQ